MSPSWPDIPGIAYGGDYNPEQWPRDVWREDVQLMERAGVNFVSMGMFSWALLEPSKGTFNFEWLDDILALFHEHGIAVDLATPTAAPPAWFYAAHPDSRVKTREGLILNNGSRGMPSHSSAAYRKACLRITEVLAARYADHPAVYMWHVHNEYGAPISEDYSDQSIAAFRHWLQERYETLDHLNEAWGTAFWGQTYGEWDHIQAPAVSGGTVNPAQRLDFARFTDHQLRQCFIAERDLIRQFSDKPITTNLMANQHWGCDLWKWSNEMDFVSTDHYLLAADSSPEIHLAMAADLTRSLSSGRPWFLMEHSTSAVNWQPRNTAKRPGEMARNSLAHFARGADGIGFFQWRQSRYGAEKFHSAMLPHNGTDTRIWREVVNLGTQFSALAEARGSRVEAKAAILWDFESFWAQDLEGRPSADLNHKERIRAYYEELWLNGITVDFALPSHSLSNYSLVVVPAQYLLRQREAENLTQFVRNGGTLLVSYFSGIVDENDALHPGGLGSPLYTVLGLRIEEFLPLLENQQVSLMWHKNHEPPAAPLKTTADTWQEDIKVTSAQTIASFEDGPGAGLPAVTRNEFGNGTAWYVSTRLAPGGTRHLMNQIYEDAEITPVDIPRGVESVTRRSEDNRHSYTTFINHTDQDAVIPRELLVGASGDLLTGSSINGTLILPAGQVAVVEQSSQ